MTIATGLFGDQTCVRPFCPAPTARAMLPWRPLPTHDTVWPWQRHLLSSQPREVDVCVRRLSIAASCHVGLPSRGSSHFVSRRPSWACSEPSWAALSRAELLWACSEPFCARHVCRLDANSAGGRCCRWRSDARRVVAWQWVSRELAWVSRELAWVSRELAWVRNWIVEWALIAWRQTPGGESIIHVYMRAGMHSHGQK